MKKLFAICLLLMILLSSCTVQDGGGTSAPSDTTAPEVTNDDITTDGATTEPPETEQTVTGFEGIDGRWYFNWTPHLMVPGMHASLTKDLTAADKQFAVQTPLVYEETKDGISIRIDFFQEYYRKGMLLQMGITLTNQRDAELRMTDNTGVGGYSLRLEAGEARLDSDDLWMSPDDITLASIGDGNLKFTLKPGESRILERVIPLAFLPSEEGAATLFIKYRIASSEIEGGSESINWELHLPVVKLTEELPEELDSAEISE